MKQSFTLGIEPFSINRMFANTRNFKTSAYRDWSSQIIHRLSDEAIASKLKSLRETFDPNKHSFSIALTFLYPKAKFIRKEGGISAKTHDISNVEKPLIDIIFLPEYAEHPHPYGCQNLMLDDKYITKMVSKKGVSPDLCHYIKVEIKIENLPSKLIKE